MRSARFLATRFLAALTVAMLAGTGPGLQQACGHEALARQITALSQQIAAQPTDPALWLRRAELHRLDRDLGSALRDLRQVELLAPQRPELPVAWGRFHLDRHQPALAVIALHRATALTPAPPDAWALLAEALQQTDDADGAERAWRIAIESASPPSPDHCLARAALLKQLQRPVDALDCIDDGLRRIGPCLVLELRALEFEEGLARYPQALARLQRLADAAERPEPWWIRIGQLQHRLGRDIEARDLAERAIAALDGLPGRLRRRPLIARQRAAALDLLTALR